MKNKKVGWYQPGSYGYWTYCDNEFIPQDYSYIIKLTKKDNILVEEKVKLKL